MTDKKPEVLIVGAGSIGRVYGYHLFKGGANVHYYIREHNKQNFTNFPLRFHKLTSSIRWFNKSHTEKFSDFSIVTNTDIAKGDTSSLPEHLDYTIFTLPAHCSSKEDWFKSLITTLDNKYQKNIYYCSAAPDVTGMKRFNDMGIDNTQLISGQIGMDCYFAPLPNQKFEIRGEDAKKDDAEDNPNKVLVYSQSGYECFGQLANEAKEATDRLVSMLNQGGLNAQNINKDTEYGIRFPVMLPMFMSYTIYNWNFLEVGKHFTIMKLVTGSMREIAKVITKRTDGKCSSSLKAMTYIPTLRISTIFFVPFFVFLHIFATRVSSLDIETIGNINYNGKLRSQTDFLINFICDDAKKYNIEMTNFNKLIKKYKASQKDN